MPPSSSIMEDIHPILDRSETVNLDNHRNTKYYKRCYEVVEYIVNKRLGKKQKWSKIGEKLYESCYEMNLKYEPFFHGLPAKLMLNQNNLYESCVDVMKEVLCDNECNFGRIISMHTFCLVLAEHCSENPELNACMDQVLKATADIMYQNREWFQKNNEWEGLVDFFTHPTDKLWKGVLFTTVGLSAIAGMIYAHS